jgi:hypothetical protein
MMSDDAGKLRYAERTESKRLSGAVLEAEKRDRKRSETIRYVEDEPSAVWRVGGEPCGMTRSYICLS